jgi:hypothetical protein
MNNRTTNFGGGNGSGKDRKKPLFSGAFHKILNTGIAARLPIGKNQRSFVV